MRFILCRFYKIIALVGRRCHDAGVNRSRRGEAAQQHRPTNAPIYFTNIFDTLRERTNLIYGENTPYSREVFQDTIFWL